jgi:hypothetical protein
MDLSIALQECNLMRPHVVINLTKDFSTSALFFGKTIRPKPERKLHMTLTSRNMQTET